jgi:hypothetical protein
VKAHAESVGLLEDAVDGQRVQVRMHVEAATEKLRAADRAGLCAVNAREPPGLRWFEMPDAPHEGG